MSLEALQEKVATLGTVAAWKEYMSFCFKTRHELEAEATLERGTVQPSESIVTSLDDYKSVCTLVEEGGGRTFVMYGPFGSGKSQTLLSMLRGSSALNPERGIYVGSKRQESMSGKDYLDLLCKSLSFPGEPTDLAAELIEVATQPPAVQAATDYLGCCAGIEDVDDAQCLIRFSPGIEDTEGGFDKFPMIVLDNVSFPFPNNGNRSTLVEEHPEFYKFIIALFGRAYGQKVVVFLGVSVVALAKTLVTLNGTTKIVPATASITDDPNNKPYDTIKQKDTISENPGLEVTYFWKANLGWTKGTLYQFLQRKFRGATHEDLDQVAQNHFQRGNLRGAIMDLAKRIRGSAPASSLARGSTMSTLTSMASDRASLIDTASDSEHDG